MYNREPGIMRKLLGRTAPDTSAGDAPSASASFVPTNYRPPRAQDAAYAAGAPISCLDVSPDRRSVALGGPHVLKTVVLDDASPFDFAPAEGVDVRSTILSQPSVGPKANSASDQLNIRDVKWNDTNMIFTACANGRIFAYDVARLAAGGADAHESIHIQEDSRQVNTLDVNPHLKSWLLSGGQDGFARIFDTANAIHTRQGFITFRQRFAGLRCIDPIRQVKWSPRVGHEMAACTDSGVVLKWDVRQPSKPLLRINAHEKACTSIAWHPDGLHLISAGSDAKLHVWEMGNSADRRQKPKWAVSTPAPVAAVSWRPAMWSATARGRRAAQVAVSYDESSVRRYGTSAVHIWDLSRPTMPYKEIDRFESPPSALSWQDQDLLWTVGQDGMFNQCDVAFAPRSVDRLPTSAVDFSSRGDVLMFLDERPQQPRPRASMAQTSVQQSSFTSSSPQTPRLSLSKSNSDEDLVGSFLAPRRGGNHKRRPSDRTSALSATPPSGGSVEDARHVLGLGQSIKATGTFKLQQAMAFGHIPAAKTVPQYQYLSSIYLETLANKLPSNESGDSLLERVNHILEQYARAAEGASLFRLAQTWRILSFAITMLLKRRAQYHLETRISRSQRLKHEMGRIVGGGVQPPVGKDMPRRSSTDRVESTSNAPTPIAKPVDYEAANPSSPYRPGKVLSPIAEPESFSIGPNVHETLEIPEIPRRRLDSVPVSFTSEESDKSQASITEGYDFYDMDALSHAVGGAFGRPGGRAMRHDSTDSYEPVFSISEGSRRTSSPKRPGLRSDPKGSDSSDYHSRIRGRELPGASSSRRPVPESPEDVFMISQTTMRSDEYPSQPSFPSQDSESQPNESHIEQAQNPSPPAPPSPTRAPEYYDPSPTIIDSDYLPWSDDPEYPYPIITAGFKVSVIPPLDPYLLIRRTLEFESRTSALNASAIILLLKPLVPDAVIDTFQASAILRQHHSRLSSMGLAVEAALLRKLCVRGWPDGLPTWGEGYPVIFAPAQRDIRVAYACSSCHRPREVDPADPAATIWVCERCRSIMAPCAVCGHRDPEPASFDPSSKSDDDEPPPLVSSWFYCPGCTHGGHASCLQTWHAQDPGAPPHDLPSKYSGGCCPVDGCGHACLPGRYRGEAAAARAEELSRVASEQFSQAAGGSASGAPSPRSGVRSDGFEVPQSRAVGMAREALGKAPSNSASGGGGILSSSPGKATGGAGTERERRKNVKFARPDRS